MTCNLFEGMSESPIAVPAREVGPGGTIRFAVGALHGLRSSTWRIWSAKHTSDVYLAQRAVAGVAKISLHQSGFWCDSFVSSEKAERFLPSGASRHVDLWRRPAPFAEGWRRAYTIIVPWTELRPWPDVEPGDVVFAPHPGAGYWVYVEIILLSRGTQTRLEFDEVHALGSMVLADGSEVKIAARRARPTRDEAGRLAVWREQSILKAGTFLASELRPGSNFRIGLHGSQGDGTRCTFDLAVVPPPPGHAVICTGYPELVPMHTAPPDQASAAGAGPPEEHPAG